MEDGIGEIFAGVLQKEVDLPDLRAGEPACEGGHSLRRVAMSNLRVGIRGIVIADAHRLVPWGPGPQRDRSGAGLAAGRSVAGGALPVVDAGSRLEDIFTDAKGWGELWGRGRGGRLGSGTGCRCGEGGRGLCRRTSISAEEIPVEIQIASASHGRGSEQKACQKPGGAASPRSASGRSSAGSS